MGFSRGWALRQGPRRKEFAKGAAAAIVAQRLALVPATINFTHAISFCAKINTMFSTYWSSFWKWVSDNASAVGVLSGLIPFAWTVISYIHAKRQELREKRFETYHELIKQLIEGNTPESGLFVDRQIAVIFELTNFKEYYPVTQRILSGLRTTWLEKMDKSHDSININRAIEEINLTLEHIKKH